MQEIITTQIGESTLYNADCFEIFDRIETKSINAIISDLPFGTTKCHWDSVLPLNDYIPIQIKNKIIDLNYDQFSLLRFRNGSDLISINDEWNNYHKKGLWTHYKRVIKDDGVILLFGQTPFDKTLGSSNLEWLKYEWIWEKTQATGYFNAKKMPMKAHENVLVFYKNVPTYNYQKTEGHKPVNSYTKKVEICNKTELYGKVKQDVSGGGETDRYPRSVQLFASDKQKNKLDKTSHSTQKPLALLEYFVKTYTNEGDLVLDNCAGSFTTNLACLNLNRKSIGIEKDKIIYNNGIKRLLNRKI